MGALVFMFAWLPLILIAPIYAELKVKKEKASETAGTVSKAKHY